MSGIHNAILKRVKTYLELDLSRSVSPFDSARVSIVIEGPLQGDPDPDEARIFITLHENDPDRFITGAVTGMDGDWSDEPYNIEVGSAITWKRRFTIKARCLLDITREGLDTTREIASLVRSRIEFSLLRMTFAGVSYETEYVSRPVLSKEMKGEMIQSGGPPDSYDFHIKARFSVLTTKVNDG